MPPFPAWIHHELMCFSLFFFSPFCTSRSRALPRAAGRAPGALSPRPLPAAAAPVPCSAGPETPSAGEKEDQEKKKKTQKRGKTTKIKNRSSLGEQKWGIHPPKACHSHYVHPFLSSRYFFYLCGFFASLFPPSFPHPSPPTPGFSLRRVAGDARDSGGGKRRKNRWSFLVAAQAGRARGCVRGGACDKRGDAATPAPHSGTARLWGLGVFWGCSLPR